MWIKYSSIPLLSLPIERSQATKCIAWVDEMGYRESITLHTAIHSSNTQLSKQNKCKEKSKYYFTNAKLILIRRKQTQYLIYSLIVFNKYHFLRCTLVTLKRQIFTTKH